MTRILRGQVLRFIDDPFSAGPDAALLHETDGAIVIKDGQIVDVGPAATTVPPDVDTQIEHHRDRLILPGFIDCHVHFPQYHIIASYGARLFDWLRTYTFPEEMRFADPAYAQAVAAKFLDQLARHGTTSASVYATVHPGSVTALFEAAEARGMRIATGKMMMDRSAPAALRDTAQSAYDDSAALAATWHGRGRATYVISPRFAPTSTREQLQAAGALWRAFPTAGLQTHLSEQIDEVAQVQADFPDAEGYLDVYDRAGLVGPGANLGHAIHLENNEIARMREAGAAVSHCPTSNQFLGSGLFDLATLRRGDDPIPVGLATDIGGGSSLSMLATMRSAYEVAQLRGRTLHPVEALYLATCGSAQVMRLTHCVGNIATGLEADIVIVDPAATPMLADRTQRCESISEVLFALMVLGDDRCIAETISGGTTLYARHP